IGKWAFSSCSSLTSVTIPTSVTSIGECAFAYCSSLTSIVVESSNTMYDSRENCNAIIETASNTLIAGCQSTTIPNSVTSIGDGAFYGCSSLTSVTIPNSVTSLGESAFRGCSSLTSVTIPNSVTSIGEDAFQACSSIADIYCYATTPPVCDDDNTFSGVSKRCYVHVPAGTIPNYQVATGWKYFSKFLEISEETSISETEQQNKSSRKIIRDGQVLILRNGVTYDMMGNTL
ncbi:MAG: leucine-rich repeat domain-containing protein, partial [Bacteroidales bacterium]|nr:leucine-rich repeat domain-containing protein [Bacteroidales bacterium]